MTTLRLAAALLLATGCGSGSAGPRPDAGAKSQKDATVVSDSGAIDAAHDVRVEGAAAPEAGDASKTAAAIVAYASGYAPDIDWFSVDGDWAR